MMEIACEVQAGEGLIEDRAKAGDRAADAVHDHLGHIHGKDGHDAFILWLEQIQPGDGPYLIIWQQGKLGAEIDVYFPHGLGAEPAVAGDPGRDGLPEGAEASAARYLVASAHLKEDLIIGAAEVEAAADETVFIAKLAGGLQVGGPSFGRELFWYDGVCYLDQGAPGDLQGQVDLGGRQRRQAVRHQGGNGGRGAYFFG